MSKKSVLFVAIMITLLCLVVPVSAQQKSDSPVVIGMKHASIVNLIAFPFRYDAARVRIVGHVRIREEANAVYLSSSDAEYEITKNGIWLELTPSQMSDSQKYDGQVCLLEGVFNIKNKGEMGLWSGALEDIREIEILNK